MGKMGKRFTDTYKWTRNKWFRKLDNDTKLFWLYMMDTCDPVGVYEEDVEFASILLGTEYDKDKLLGYFGDRIKLINKGEKWWIKDFCDFQYSILREENVTNKPHQSYISLLKKHSLWIEYAKTIHSLKEKEKDIEKEEAKKKDKYRAKPKDLNMVIEYFKEKEIPNPEINAELFYDHYTANGWVRGKAKIKIQSWKHCLSQWDFSENEKPKKITYTYECPDKHMKFSSDNPQISMYCRKDGCRKEMIRLEVE